DDKRQAERVDVALQTAADEGESVMLCNIVLVESVWVLEEVYRLKKADVLLLLEKILSTAQFEVEDRDIVRQAVEDFRTTKADFADCLIGRKNRLLGCAETLTFDEDLKKLEAFKLL